MKRIRALPKLPERDPQGHKGLYGRILVVGGSVGMVGAPALAANAALRACPEFHIFDITEQPHFNLFQITHGFLNPRDSQIIAKTNS